MRAVFDTNIVIDYLNGITAAEKEIAFYGTKSISYITYIETLVGIDDLSIIAEVKAFLSSFEIIEIDRNIADLAIAARKKYKLKVPDAVILATAQAIGAILVTRNNKDFSEDIPIIRVPYRL